MGQPSTNDFTENPFVILKTCRYRPEADSIQSKLMRAKIECRIFFDDFIGSSLAFSTGARVMVRRNDYEKAKKLAGITLN